MSQFTDIFAGSSDGAVLRDFVRTGSQEAFAEIVARHGGLVLGVCRRVLGNAHGAEDAAQAVFLTLAQKAGELGGRDSVAGWLQRVAWHVALRAREAAAIRREHEQEAAEMRSHESMTPATWDDLRPVLDEELAALPEKYRLPLVLHHLEGRSIEEAAKLFHVRTGTMASWLSRGRVLLRKRLARRGLDMPGASLAGCLATVGGATVSLSFVASTAKAAALLTAGHAAAGSLVSVQVAALFKGTMHMMFLTKLKLAAALLLTALLPIAAAVTVYHFTAEPVAAQNPGNPGPQAGPNGQIGGGGGFGGGTNTVDVETTVWPNKGATPDYARLQGEALTRKIDVSYQRAYVSEVVGDLEKRSGVRVAYAQPLGDGWTFTLEAKGITTKAVLEKLSADGKFDLSLRPDLAVLSQKAGDAVLADLAKQLGNGDRWERCKAVWALGNLADPRIYPLLAKALADPDEGVAEWTLRALEKHSRMDAVMGDAEKDAVVKAVLPWLKDVGSKTDYQLTGYPNMTWGKLAPGDRSLRVALLAATGRPEATAALIETLRTVKSRIGAMHFVVRDAAAQALALDPACIPDAVALLPMFDQEIAAAAKEPPLHSWLLGQAQGVKRDVILSLMALQVPEIQQAAQKLINKPQRSREDEALAVSLISDYSRVLDLQVVIRQKLEGLATLSDQPAPAGPNGGPALSPMPGYGAITALRTLVQISDPAITAEILKVVKDDKAYHVLAKNHAWAFFGLALPVDDPEMRSALLARLNEKGDNGKLAAMSLAQSHDPAVAEALIASLKDGDDEWLAAVGDALAQTHDSRALAALVATVKLSREWQDPESLDQALPVMERTRPTNPRKILLRSILKTRDPQAFADLASLATDPVVSDEVRTTAQQQLRGAVVSAAQMDRLMELLKNADVDMQREVLGGGTLGEPMPYSMNGAWVPPVAPTTRCANDPRWVDLVAKQAANDEHEQRAAGFIRPLFRNMVLDMVPAFMTPTSEKAVLDLCQDKDEHVAFFAGTMLNRFQDPQVTVNFEP